MFGRAHACCRCMDGCTIICAMEMREIKRKWINIAAILAGANE
jgi:hypothetical protein